MGSSVEAGAETVKISLAAWWSRFENYLRRLPLLTKTVFFAITLARVVEWIGVPLEEMWALDPERMDLSQMHRLNTYILVHANVVHMLVNLIAVTPLLERFEREVGTLKTALLVAGPIVTFPAGLYLAIEMGIFRGGQAVVGVSALVFTLLAVEAVKTCGFQPYYRIVGWEIPTWTTPIFWMVFASFLWPASSALGHFCGLVVGYAYACRCLRLLEPSEWILTKVEQKLGFLLLRLPWYVNLEKRQELNYMEMLPAVGGGGPREAGSSAGRFNTPGIPLGSV
ncbi:rhomboid protein 2 [Trichophaea hybrida]|nr:rhomboid protein 2 [Trichophaea hybrida]